MSRITANRLSRRGLLTASLGAGALAANGPLLPRLPRLAAASAPPTATGSDPGRDGERGSVVSVNPIAASDAAQVSAQLETIGLDTGRVRFGVDPFQIVYRTIDPSGLPTTASTLLVLPKTTGPAPRLVTWLHGTMVYRGDAPSVGAENPDRLIAYALAAAGSAVVAPDYLGLGRGPGFHPYNHTPSAVSASLDALRAGRAAAAARDRSLPEQVLVTGFSKGGRVTMALGRELQAGADPHLRLGALAPISGPYDFSGTLRAALAGEINAAPQYLAYLMVAWNRVYHLYDDPVAAFRAPYAGVVDTVFDNDHTDQEVFAAISAETPAELFTPEFLALMRQPTGPLAAALREADGSCDWSPRPPVTLYAAHGDRDVPIANAEHGQRELAARGVDVRLVDVGDVDHTTSVVLSLPRVISQFDDPDPAV
jgi:dienelactone hydrolase